MGNELRKCQCTTLLAKQRIADLEAENKRLREALTKIDALDPEDPYKFVFMDQNAAQALVMKMGKTARNALLKEGNGNANDEI